MPRRVVGALAFASAAIIVFSMTDANTQSPAPQPLEVPTRTLPVPETVSPEMQRLIGAPLSGNWNTWPKTAEEWKKLSAPGGGRGLPALRERFKVKSETHDRQRRDGLSRHPRESPGREPQPAARAHPRRLLRAAGRGSGDDRGDLHGGIRPLQGAVGRLPPSSRVPVPRRARRQCCGVEGRVEDGRCEEHGDLRHLRRRRADALDRAARQDRRSCRCPPRSRPARRCPI